MIEVQKLFLRVNNDLARKDKAGYTSSDEFNRNLEEAQSLLLAYYHRMFELDEGTLDGAAPFIKELFIPIKDQYCEFPSDYRYKLEVGYVKAFNTPNCSKSGSDFKIIDGAHWNANEVKKTLNSAIRNPTLENGLFAYTYVNNKIKVFPRGLIGNISLKYLIDPPLAVYATTDNQAEQTEDYDAANSIDLIWNPQQQPELVNIMLLFKGLEIRESLLLNWVKLQKNMQ
jgi:hypothetical protein